MRLSFIRVINEMQTHQRTPIYKFTESIHIRLKSIYAKTKLKEKINLVKEQLTDLFLK